MFTDDPEMEVVWVEENVYKNLEVGFSLENPFRRQGKFKEQQRPRKN